MSVRRRPTAAIKSPATGSITTYRTLKQAAREHSEAAIETLAAVINDESATTAARAAAARAILRRKETLWTDALRDAVMRAGEDGRVLLARIAEKRERRGTHSAPKTVTTLRSRQM